MKVSPAFQFNHFLTLYASFIYFISDQNFRCHIYMQFFLGDFSRIHQQLGGFTFLKRESLYLISCFHKFSHLFCYINSVYTLHSNQIRAGTGQVGILSRAGTGQVGTLSRTRYSRPRCIRSHMLYCLVTKIIQNSIVTIQVTNVHISSRL